MLERHRPDAPRSPRRSLRVLHTADLHLAGESLSGPERRTAARRQDHRRLRAVVDRALADAADVVLIAGDLFDHNRVPEEDLEQAHAELRRLHQPVIILPGNHDCLQRGGVHDRRDLTAGAPHVRLIHEPGGQTLEFPELDLSVWGRAMVEHEPGFHPLAGIPSRDRGQWNVALGHGFFYPARQDPDRSSPIFAEEIRDTGWDYVALGHHHVLTDVSQGPVAARYAGAPLAEGRDGHVLLVDLSAEGGVTVTVQPLV